jgi:hypothetical protein
MITFETVFPILALLKDKAYNSISDVNSTDIADNGTGFFITDKGEFMSVGHNFEKTHDDISTYELADFYAVLVSETGIELRKIIDYQAIYKKDEPENENALTGKDVAIGKIELRTDEKSSFGFDNDGSFICGYVKDKEFFIEEYFEDEEQRSELVRASIPLNGCVFYLHRIPYQTTINYSSVVKIQYLSLASERFNFYQKPFDKPNFAGLSGSPVIENGILQGIFYRGGRGIETNTHGFFIPTTNKYYNHIYHRYFKHLFVQPLEDADGSLDMSKEYPLEFDKDEDFPTGEECIRDENGETITLAYFKHKIICK